MRDGPPPASLARVLARAGRPAVPSSSRPFEVVELTAPPVDAPDPGGAPPPGRATLDPLRDAPPGTRSEMPEPPRAPRPEAPRRPAPPVTRVTPRDRADDLGPPSDGHPLGEPSPPAAARLPDVEVIMDAAPRPRPAVPANRRPTVGTTDEHGHADQPAGRRIDGHVVVDRPGEARQPARHADPAAPLDAGPRSRSTPHGPTHLPDPTVPRTTSTAVPPSPPDAPPAPPPVVIERIDITTPPATGGASDPLAPLSDRRRGRTHHPRPQAR